MSLNARPFCLEDHQIAHSPDLGYTKVSKKAYGKVGLKMQSKRFQIGIIGCGMWGKILARGFQRDRRAEVSWLYSRTEATALKAQTELGFGKGTTSLDAVLKDKGVDAVAIASPPFMHAQHLAEALKAGKHVLIEKPLAESPQSLRKILALSKAFPHLIVLEASARYTRLSMLFHLIKNLIQEGRLGTVYHIHQQHLLPTTYIEYNPHGNWAMFKRLAGGGPLIDLGVYDLSFNLGLFEDKLRLKRVYGFKRRDLRLSLGQTPESDIEQHAAFWLEFKGGLTYYYERGSGAHLELNNQTIIYGSKGVLRFNYFPWEPRLIEFLTNIDGKIHQDNFSLALTELPQDETDSANQALLTHFLDCLEGKSLPIMTVEMAAQNLNILFRLAK